MDETASSKAYWPFFNQKPHTLIFTKKRKEKNLFWVILHNHKHLIKTTTQMSGTVPLLHLKISNIKIIFYFFYFLSNYTYLGMQRNLCTHTDLLLCSSRCLHQLDCNTDSAGGGWVGGHFSVCVCRRRRVGGWEYCRVGSWSQ